MTALDNVSLKVDRGEFLVVTGRSGSGKTTLLNIAAGLARPTSGEVFLDGADLWSLSDAHAVPPAQPEDRLRVPVPQPAAVSDRPRERHPALVIWRRSRRSPRARAATELLEMVGLSDKLGSFPRQLSAGQQQRVVIARALVQPARRCSSRMSRAATWTSRPSARS